MTASHRGRLARLALGGGRDLRPWHAQWLGTRDLRSDLRTLTATMHGTVLDFGCGDGPYRSWLPRTSRPVGADVTPRGAVDVVVAPDGDLPFRAASFDGVLCTQVLEFVDEPEHLMSEFSRCLRPGGRVVITLPFLYNEHGDANDLRRYSVLGARRLVERHLRVIEARGQGRAGTTLGLLFMNFVHGSLAGRRRRLLKAALVPLLLPLAATVNGLARLVDRVDGTGRFYTNVLVVAERPATVS